MQPSPLFGGMVLQLLDQYPELQIYFHNEISIKIIDDILKGHLDIGLVTDPYPHPLK